MTVPPLNEFIRFVMYEWAGAHDVPRFFVGVYLGGAEHSLAGRVRAGPHRPPAQGTAREGPSARQGRDWRKDPPLATARARVKPLAISCQPKLRTDGFADRGG